MDNIRNDVTINQLEELNVLCSVVLVIITKSYFGILSYQAKSVC